MNAIPETCPQCGATTLHGSLGYRMYACRTVILVDDRDQLQTQTGHLCRKQGEIPLREAQ